MWNLESFADLVRDKFEHGKTQSEDQLGVCGLNC